MTRIVRSFPLHGLVEHEKLQGLQPEGTQKCEAKLPTQASWEP